MQKRKAIKKPEMPKAIVIMEEDNLYKMYRQWNGGKVAHEPFFITEDVGELTERYEKACKEWRIKPDIKKIKFIINKHQKVVQHDKANFLEGYRS